MAKALTFIEAARVDVLFTLVRDTVSWRCMEGIDPRQRGSNESEAFRGRRPDLKSGKGGQPTLGGFDSRCLPPCYDARIEAPRTTQQ